MPAYTFEIVKNGEDEKRDYAPNKNAARKMAHDLINKMDEGDVFVVNCVSG